VSSAQVAVIVPYFQRRPGLLAKALRSVFSQSTTAGLHCYVVDDSSPIDGQAELDAAPDLPRDRITLVRQPNGGAGSARNRALNGVAAGTTHVAFLDSDDEWRPEHIANALKALDASGADAYFSDWWSYNFPQQTNFERIRALDPAKHQAVCAEPPAYALGVTPIEHITRDGGGVIQTSTVVYRFPAHAQLRFREEFFNGQDFFFWMDLGERGARFVFSMSVDCDNGEGINIYQSAGWGTERSMHRLRNELFVWTSVRRFYALTPSQSDNNRRTIRHLQRSVTLDLVHRIRHRKPLQLQLVKDVLRFDAAFLVVALITPFALVARKLLPSRKP
jgi:succinoglycan biosynthesis protein ExoW